MEDEQVALHFNFGHLEGKGDLCFLANGDVASCGVDGLIKIWKIQDGDISSEEEIDDEQNHSLLFIRRAASGSIISVSSDCRVTEHKQDDTLEWSIARVLAKTTSVPKSITYLEDSDSVVVGLEEGKMVAISLKDSSVVPFLPAHPAPVIRLVKHPKESLLASFCADGCLRVWNSNSRKVLCTETLLPTFSSSIHGESLGLDWSVDGKLAATCGVKGELVVFEWNSSRLHKCFTLQNNDQTMVSSIQFSSDGKYLCSASKEGEIIVYESDSRDSLRESAHDTTLAAMSWHPNPTDHHQIVFMDCRGQLALWDRCLPLISALPPTEKNEEIEEEEEEEIIPARKRKLQRLNAVLGSDNEDDCDGDESIRMEHEDKEGDQEEESRRKSFPQDEMDFDEAPYHYRTETSMQQPFQVGCAPEHKNKRCLSWTLFGMIVSTVEEDGSRMIDITLNDSSKAQPKRMTDHFRFTKAALGENGAVFSSEVDERLPATVFYRPFESWTSNSEWRIQLDYAEQIVGLSIGSQFVSVATDQHSVRILTSAGIQSGIVSLPGPFVCSSGFRDKLAIAYHRSAPFAHSQSLGLLIYDFSLNSVIQQQDIALSPKSELHWLGWDEDGSVMTVDDSGIVRSLVFSSQPQLSHGRLQSASSHVGMWTPIASLPNDEDLFHWVVGCTKEQTIFVECTAGDRHPILMPFYTPSLCSLPYTAPLLPQTPASENQLFVDRIHLQSTSETAEQVVKQQQLDKSLLRLFHASCNDDKLQRALDFAQLLKFPKAMDIAIQVANSANITSLAEHLSELKAIILQKAAPPSKEVPQAPRERQRMSASKEDLMEESSLDSSEEDSEQEEKENLPAHPSPIKQSSKQLKNVQEIKDNDSPNTRESPKMLQNEKVINPFQKGKKPTGVAKKGLFFLNDIIQEEKKIAGNKRKFQGKPPSAKRIKKL